MKEANLNQSPADLLFKAAKDYDNPELIASLISDQNADYDAVDAYDYTPLHYAIIYQNVKNVEILLRYGANTNVLDMYGRDILSFTCDIGNLEVINLLIKNGGVDVNIVSISQESPLMIAAKAGHAEAVKILIAAGADKEAIDSQGWTALMMAADGGHAEAMKILLEAGANKEAFQTGGHTSLMLAAQNGHAEAVKILLEAGVNKDAFQIGGYTSLMIAAGKGHVEAMKILLEAGANKDAFQTGGYTSLMLAAQNGHAEAVKILLEAGADKESINSVRWTALMIAAQNGHAEAVKILIAAGADKEAIDSQGWTALMIAADGGHGEVVKILLEAGAIKDTFSSDDGYTALMIAADGGHAEVVKILLEAGANKDVASTLKGWTALMIAADDGHAEAMKILLEAGVDKELTNSAGWTALMIAAKGHAEAMKILLEAGANKDVAGIFNGWTALMIAADDGHAESVKILLEAGVDKELTNSAGWTALMIAAKKGHADVLKILLEAGAIKDVASTLKGCTSLMLAAQEGHAEVVKILLKAGANKDVASTLKRSTSLMMAADNGHADVLKILLEAGANKEAFNINGSTSLMIAAKKGHGEVVKILLEAGAIKDAFSSDDGYTALMIAAENGRAEVVKVLIKNGANINAVNHDGQSVLHLSPQHFNKQFLLPIFKEAIDEGDTKVLVNLCKYEHYRTQLSIIDINDSPQNNSIVEEFIRFLAKYNSIPETITDKVQELNNIQAQKLKVIGATESSNSKYIGKILKFLTGSKSAIYEKVFDTDGVVAIISGYLGWQKQWSPTLELTMQLQTGQAYQSIDDVAILTKAFGVDVAVVSNKNLDNLQQAFQFSNEVKKAILIKFPTALAETFEHYPQVGELFAKDYNKIIQFMWLKLIAKTLSYNIAYYSDADSIIHFSGGKDAKDSYKIYETPDGQQLITKQALATKVIKLMSVDANEDTAMDDAIDYLIDNMLFHKRAREDAEQGPATKIARLEEAPAAGDVSTSMPHVFFSNGNSFVQDYHSSSQLPSFLKPFGVMLPKITIEWPAQPVQSDVLQIKSVQEPKSEHSNKAISYSYGDVIFGLKALDAAADGLKVINEPTIVNTVMFLKDAAYLGVVLTATSGYLPLVSGADIAVQAYNGGYAQALTQVGAVAGHILLSIVPTMFGISLAPVSEALTISYIAELSEQVSTKFSSLYSIYGTPESQLKSDLAYADFYNNLGWQDSAKRCLLDAMRIVKEDSTNKSESSVQEMASEYDLVGELCKLDPGADCCGA
ncbi:MAG: ankyrin repeat domain-containing protein [Rickettsiales bacterium]